MGGSVLLLSGALLFLVLWGGSERLGGAVQTPIYCPHRPPSRWVIRVVVAVLVVTSGVAAVGGGEEVMIVVSGVSILCRMEVGGCEE